MRINYQPLLALRGFADRYGRVLWREVSLCCVALRMNLSRISVKQVKEAKLTIYVMKNDGKSVV